MEIVSIFLTTYLPIIISSAIGFYFVRLDKKWDENISKKEKDAEAEKTWRNAQEEGLQALLRDRLIQRIKKSLEQGWADPNDSIDINHMYDAYHSLGGNGVITHLIDQFRELPPIDPESRK